MTIQSLSLIDNKMASKDNKLLSAGQPQIGDEDLFGKMASDNKRSTENIKNPGPSPTQFRVPPPPKFHKQPPRPVIPESSDDEGSLSSNDGNSDSTLSGEGKDLDLVHDTINTSKDNLGQQGIVGLDNSS